MDRERFLKVQDVYDSSARSAQYFWPVTHPTFEDFGRRVGRLKRRLGDQSGENFFASLLQPLYSFLGFHWRAPAPFNNEISVKLSDDFAASSNNIDQSAPGYASEVKNLQKIMEELVATPDNPMSVCLQEILSKGTDELDTALVVAKRRYRSWCDELIDNLGLSSSCTTVIPDELRGGTCYDRIVVFGQHAVVGGSPFVFSAPRSADIYRIGYRRPRFPTILEMPFITCQDNKKYFEFTRVNVDNEETRDEGDIDSQDELEELLPIIVPGRARVIEQIVTARPSCGGSPVDVLVATMLVSLENGNGVFLQKSSPETSQNRRYHAILLSEDGEAIVKRIPLQDFEHDMFIVLRTNVAEGDYLDFVADFLISEQEKLGEAQAIAIRNQQSRWKKLLADKVETLGYEAVVSGLKDCGCLIASPNNVRNWRNPRLVAPRNISDVTGLMTYLGLDPDLDEILINVETLRAALTQAGVFLSRQLRAQIGLTKDLDYKSTIEREYNLSDDGAGTVTAYRISNVFDDEYLMPSADLPIFINME